jgi:hypothetical protein
MLCKHATPHQLWTEAASVGRFPTYLRWSALLFLPSKVQLMSFDGQIRYV